MRPSFVTKNKIAFLIAAHNDPDHLRKLVQALAEHDVYIHWDKKSGSLPDIDGAVFVPKRISVFWAGFSQVEATISLMETARASQKNYLKYVLLSGADYPIQPLSELVEVFTKDNDWNYLNAVEVRESPHLSQLVKIRLWRDGIFPKSIPRTKPVIKIERYIRAAVNLALQVIPKPRLDMVLYHGSSWWALSPQAVDIAISTYYTNLAFKKFYRFTFASDEQFFQTCIRNSPLAQKCDPPLPYEGRGTYRTANLHIIDRSLTKWFTLKDKDEICQSKKFFVRKLRSSDSAELVEYLDHNVLSTQSRNMLEDDTLCGKPSELNSP